MALGLRMFRARTASGVTLNIEEIAGAQPLSCESCGTAVVFSQGYTRGDGIPVSSYLRLAPNARHHPTCAYDALNQIGILCGLGQDLEAAARPLVALSQSNFEFRLNLPPEARASLRAQGKADTSSFKERLQRAWSGAVLTPYCRSAVGLARIAALVEGNVSLADTVSVRYKGEELAWRDFFYGEGSGERLLTWLRKRVSQNGRHPVAVLVRPKVIEKNPAGFARNIRCGGERLDHSNDAVFLMPRIYAASEILARVELGKDYIVFGEWWAQSDRSKPDKRGIAYENASVQIYQVAQFARLAP